MVTVIGIGKLGGSLLLVKEAVIIGKLCEWCTKKKTVVCSSVGLKSKTTTMLPAAVKQFKNQ